MKNIKNIIIPVIISIAFSSLIAFVINKNNSNLEGINVDTIRGSANTYAYQIASTTASLVSDFKNRAALECVNNGANNVHLYLTATSTGVNATSGILMVANGGSYTPEFIWPGQIWVISETGTSSVVCQETTK